jgi:hypothetical protein
MAEQASMLAVHEQHNTEMSDEFSQKLRNVELEFEQKLQAQLQDHQVFVQVLIPIMISF